MHTQTEKATKRQKKDRDRERKKSKTNSCTDSDKEGKRDTCWETACRDRQETEFRKRGRQTFRQGWKAGRHRNTGRQTQREREEYTWSTQAFERSRERWNPRWKTGGAWEQGQSGLRRSEKNNADSGICRYLFTGNKLLFQIIWGPRTGSGETKKAQCLVYFLQADWKKGLGTKWEHSLGKRSVSDHPRSQQHTHWPHTEPGPPAQDGRQPAHRLAPDWLQPKC